MNISRKVKRNKFFPLIVIIVFIVVFVKTYSGKKSDLPQEKRTSTLIWGSIGDASLLNPILATDSASGDISGLVFNGLVKYDKDLELVGDLAGSWA